MTELDPASIQDRLSRRDGVPALVLSQPESWPPRAKLIAIASAVAAYALVFAALGGRVGGDIVILSIVPVIVAAWLTGVRGGVVAAIGMLPLNLALGIAVAGEPSLPWLTRVGALGTSSEVIVGAVTGFVSDIAARSRELRRERDRFLSMASHELRTPMASVLGYAELLVKKASLSGEHEAWLGIVHEESQRLTEMLDDVLDVTHIQLGNTQLSIEQINIEDALWRAVRLVEPTSDAHSFSVFVEPMMPTALADSEKLKQVLWNLLSNAIKYSPEGGPITVAAFTASAQAVLVSVSDSGVGITLEEQDRIFEPFNRLKTAETAHVRGTGLGLYIVQSLVEEMHGHLTLKSVRGKGSTFRFTLPLSRGK